MVFCQRNLYWNSIKIKEYRSLRGNYINHSSKISKVFLPSREYSQWSKNKVESSPNFTNQQFFNDASFAGAQVGGIRVIGAVVPVWEDAIGYGIAAAVVHVVRVEGEGPDGETACRARGARGPIQTAHRRRRLVLKMWKFGPEPRRGCGTIVKTVRLRRFSWKPKLDERFL